MNAKEIEVTKEAYDGWLDEIYPPLEIGYLTFDASRVLKELDPIAYRCGMADISKQWACSECRSVYETKEDAEECCNEDNDDDGNDDI